jgi:hypothetical protein
MSDYEFMDDGLNSMITFVAVIQERTQTLADLVPTICELKKHDLISDWHLSVDTRNGVYIVRLDFKIPSLRHFYNYIPLAQ